MTDSSNLPDSTAPSVSRVFIGIHLPHNLSKVITEAVREFDPFGSEARFLPAGNHHITLLFFSSIQTDRVGELMRCMEEAGKVTPRFKISLGEPGFFSSTRETSCLLVGSCS